MRDDHLPQVEIRGEVKGVPKQVCEASQVNNLNVGMIGTRVGKIGRESTNYDQMDIRRLIKNKSHLQIPSLYLYLIYFLITEVNLKTLWSKLCQ